MQRVRARTLRIDRRDPHECEEVRSARGCKNTYGTAPQLVWLALFHYLTAVRARRIAPFLVCARNFSETGGRRDVSALAAAVGSTSMYNTGLGTVCTGHLYDRVEDRDRGEEKRAWE